jgi:hypothetical protein
MTIIAPQSPLLSVLNGDAMNTPLDEALIDLEDVMTDTLIERDCLCGTFSAGDRLFALPVEAIKSPW